MSSVLETRSSVLVPYHSPCFVRIYLVQTIYQHNNAVTSDKLKKVKCENKTIVIREETNALQNKILPSYTTIGVSLYSASPHFTKLNTQDIWRH